MSLSLQRLGPVPVAFTGTVMCALTAYVTVAGSSSGHVWLEACVRVLIVAAPLAVGMYALGRPPFERFGALLILAGAGAFVGSLSASENAVLYSSGRVAGWIVDLGITYLVLSFPSGRLVMRRDRVLVGSIAVVVGFLFVPSALLVDQFPVPSQWTSCDAACPANAFMVVATEPAFVDDVLRPVRELLVVLLSAAATVSVALRMRGTTRLMRRTLAPVTVAAAFRLAIFGATLAARRVAPDSVEVDVGVWLLALTLPLMAVAFLIGLARWHLFIAAAMQRLVARLRAHPEPADLRAALAYAFEDRSLEIVYRVGDDSWADASGEPVTVPDEDDAARCLTPVLDGDRCVAGIVHDTALRYDRAFLDIATSYALMTLENHRLSAQTAALLREVRESRGRIQAAADDERRRIERDLHDGAQQRLVALRIKLELAADRADEADAVVLRGLGNDVEEALDDVRSLARGIYPAPLTDRGLVEALRSAALRMSLPTTVLAAGVGRYPPELESAAYFCCLEALQNTEKHAHGARAAVVELSANGALLNVEIRDDGAGFDPARVDGGGVGFTSMRDRMAAVGGMLEIRSRPGAGTQVRGRIPLEATRAGR